MKPPKSFAYFPQIALLILITLLAAPRLSRSIWSDEWWSLYYAGFDQTDTPISIAATLQRVASTYHELNPPGYYVVLNAWGQSVGSSELALRWLSLLCGLLAVAALYRAASDGFGKHVGFYAALTFGASAFWINYLHDMRMYTLALLWVILTTLTYWRTLHGQHWRRNALCLGMFSAALLWTHYFAALMLGVLGAYHL